MIGAVAATVAKGKVSPREGALKEADGKVTDRRNTNW